MQNNRLYRYPRLENMINDTNLHAQTRLSLYLTQTPPGWRRAREMFARSKSHSILTFDGEPQRPVETER